MPDGRCRRIVVVCEAAADQRTACTVADRALCESLDRADRDQLNGLREWSGLEPATDFITWKDVKREAERKGVRTHGHFSGKPGAPDACAARRALVLLGRAKRVPDAVMLIRDSDNHPDRLLGLRQARNSTRRSFAVVIGVAHTKRECWVLAAFEPGDDDEQTPLTRLRQELGFNPCTSSHRLTAASESAKRSAKRVLESLCGGDAQYAQSWLDSIPLATLRERGHKNGLSDFIDEIETRLAPLLT